MAMFKKKPCKIVLCSDRDNQNLIVKISVLAPNPDPVGSAFNLGLDPGSGSVFGIRIWIPDPDA